jgi:hypothetical protein
MYQSYADNIPLKSTSIAYTSIAANEADPDPWRQDTVFLDGKTRKKQSTAWWQRVGWPVGALGSATMATVALLVNLAVLIWTLRTFQFNSGIARVFAGNCHDVERINTWVHLGINAVSTLLLSGSNYCMQILSAPTRKEVDKAHGRKKWLDVGVPSVRNLRNVAIKKVVMWWLLGLSSVPLHLMYNSVFFSTIATNEYDIIFANEAFIDGGPQGAYNETEYPGIQDIPAQAKTWDRLERADCINAYATDFLNTRRALVAVIVDNTTAQNDSVKRVLPYLFDFSIDNPDSFDPYAWICEASDAMSRYGFTDEEMTSSYHCSQSVPKVKAHADRWNSLGFDIDYCLSEAVEGKCSLNFSLSIIIIVMVCNVGKAVIMVFIAFGVRDRPLITIGDAIDSFLNVNDWTTKGMCLTSKECIKAAEYNDRYHNVIDTYAMHAMGPLPRKKMKSSSNWKAAPIEYKSSSKRWAKAVSASRWVFCMAL